MLKGWTTLYSWWVIELDELSGSITGGVKPRHGRLLRLPVSQISSRAPCSSSLFLPESYDKGSSADLLYLTETSAYELYLLTEGRVYRVQANQEQYLLDKCTRVFLLFHIEPKGAWGKGKRWALDDIFGIRKGHMTSSGWRIPSHGVFALPPLPMWMEGEQAEDWTWVLPRRARRLSGLQERGNHSMPKPSQPSLIASCSILCTSS